MMLSPAERLVKHSSRQAWGEGRMVPRPLAGRSASPRQRPRDRSSLFSTNACAASQWSSVKPVWM